MFVKDACALMGLSIESPLTVAVNAGATALPSLLNIKQVCIKKTRQTKLLWSNHLLGNVLKDVSSITDSFCKGNATKTSGRSLAC